MRKSLPVIVAALLCLAACAPAGMDTNQVAAVVAGKRISVADLESEMRVTGVANPKDPNVRRAVLERMVQRKLMASAAREDGVLRSPDALRVRAISRENLDAGLARTAIMAAVAKPKPAEAQAFVDAHPELFAARTLYLIDRIDTAANPDPAAIAALAPTRTLEEAEAVLTAHKIAFRRAPAALDSLRVLPEFAQVLRRLPAGEVFVIPEGRGVTISRIKASETHPVTGAPALAIAGEMLLRARQAQALAKEMAALKANVTYGPQFAPPPTAAKSAAK